MTRKSYIELATDLKREREFLILATATEHERMIALNAHDSTTDLFIAAMQRDNPRFDKQRFLTAVGR